MEETNFYNDRVVSVTSARVVMDNLTFAVRNISSVRNVMIQPPHAIDVILIVIGIMIGLIGFCVVGWHQMKCERW